MNRFPFKATKNLTIWYYDSPKSGWTKASVPVNTSAPFKVSPFGYFSAIGEMSGVLSVCYCLWKHHKTDSASKLIMIRLICLKTGENKVFY